MSTRPNLRSVTLPPTGDDLRLIELRKRLLDHRCTVHVRVGETIKVRKHDHWVNVKRVFCLIWASPWVGPTDELPMWNLPVGIDVYIEEQGMRDQKRYLLWETSGEGVLVQDRVDQLTRQSRSPLQPLS